MVARPAGRVGGLFVDQQVMVRGAWPSVATVLQPVQQQLQGEVVERAAASGDGQPAVAKGDVVEREGDDLGSPGCTRSFRARVILSIRRRACSAGAWIPASP